MAGPRGHHLRRHARCAQVAARGDGARVSGDVSATHRGLRGRQRPDHQDPVRARRRPLGGGGRDAIHGALDAVHLIPGRLPDRLPVLRDGKVPLRAQPEGARDRRAGGRRGASPGGRGPAAVARRLHGHGRTDGQLRLRGRLGAPPCRPRAAWHQPAPHRGLDERAHPTHHAAERGEHPGDTCDLIARGAR